MTTPKPVITEVLLEAENVRSLVWSGDVLVDWGAGGAAYGLDRSRTRAGVCYSFPFDAAITEPEGEFAVIYCRLGTKGLLLREGQMVRELNRSFYHAATYEYPMCLFRHDGRALLAHCPEEYNQLEIEDAASGERLTKRSSSSADFFHSRLQASPRGTRLLSAGWVWQPWDVVGGFDVAEALRNPAHLDKFGWCASTGLVEESAACWQSEATILISGGDEPEDPDEVAELGTGEQLRRCGVAVHHLERNALLSASVLDKPAGTLMAVGDTHAVAFYEHPRLIRLADGVVEHAWPGIASGMQMSSIIHHIERPPPMALDPSRSRFAVAQADGIHVISFGSAA